MIKDVLKYLQPNAAIPIDMETTTALVNALKEALAQPPQPEQEPVAWMWDVNNGGGYTSRGVGLYQTDIPFAKHTPLYTHPLKENT